MQINTLKHTTQTCIFRKICIFNQIGKHCDLTFTIHAPHTTNYLLPSVSETRLHASENEKKTVYSNTFYNIFFQYHICSGNTAHLRAVPLSVLLSQWDASAFFPTNAKATITATDRKLSGFRVFSLHYAQGAASCFFS